MVLAALLKSGLAEIHLKTQQNMWVDFLSVAAKIPHHKLEQNVDIADILKNVCNQLFHVFVDILCI